MQTAATRAQETPWAQPGPGGARAKAVTPTQFNDFGKISVAPNRPFFSAQRAFLLGDRVPALLYPKTEEDYFLSPEVVVSRMQQSIPNIIIDWGRGKQWVEGKLQELIAMNAPDVIQSDLKSQLNQTVYVEVSFPEFSNQHASFYVSRDSEIFVECSKPEAENFLQHVAERICSVLGYRFRIVQS